MSNYVSRDNLLQLHKVKFPAFAEADKLTREALADNLAANAVVNTSKVARAGRPPSQFPAHTYVDAVGKHLLEYLHARELTRRNFAELVGIPIHIINNILRKGGVNTRAVPLPAIVLVAIAIDYDLNEFKHLALQGNKHD